MSIFLYGLFVDQKLLLLQEIIIALYFVGYYIKDHGKTSPRKKLSFSTWGAPKNPAMYGTAELDCQKIDDFIESFNRKHPETPITYTHFFLKVIGKCMEESPSMNGMLAFGQYVPFDNVNVTTLVSVGKGQLTGITIKNVNKLSMFEIRTKTRPKIREMKKDKNKEFSTKKALYKIFPCFMIDTLTQLVSFLSYSVGLGIKALGVKQYSFGNVLFTNVSSMVYHKAFGSLISFTRAVVVFTLCRPEERAIVDSNDQIVIRKMVNFNLSIDHRFVDAAGLQALMKAIYKYSGNPQLLLD